MEKKNQRYKKCCTKEKRNANRKVLPAPAFPSTSRCGVWPGVEARPCQSSLNLNFNFKCHNFPIYLQHERRFSCPLAQWVTVG